MVDLDGTLLETDLLIESAFAYLRSNPLRLLWILLWLLRGKAYLKTRLGREVELDIPSLPYNRGLVERLEQERRKGRPIWLATAADQHLAEAAAAHIGLFDGVLGTRDGHNLKGTAKREALEQRFGRGGFEYVGNERADLVIWEAASAGWAVNPGSGVERELRRLGNLQTVLRTRPGSLRPLIQALRPHQWAKNLLLFVPLATSHQLFDPGLVLQATLAFVVFGLSASGVYLINDLVDLRDDRQHPSKRHRPLAAGTLPLQHALLLAPALLASSLALSLALLPLPFVGALVAYLVLTTLYSFWLKRVVMIDVITLAILYTLRIIAGAAACGLPLTFWILAFSVFIFLSLAMVKRYAELLDAWQKAQGEIPPGNATGGRGYQINDLQLVSALGGAAGYLSVLVLALYIQDPAAADLYTQPEYIWLACPILLFWISRTWLLTHRGLMPDDPVLFALKDRASQMTGVIFLLVFIAAR